MPNFVTQRWYGRHMMLTMCLFGVLVTIVSLYNWIYGMIGGVLLIGLAFLLHRAERSFRRDFIQYISILTYRMEDAGKTLSRELPIGIILYNPQGEVEWANSFVQKMILNRPLVGMKIEELFHDLHEATVIEDTIGKERPELLSDRVYINGKAFDVHHDASRRLYFLQDVSTLDELQKKYIREQVVIGFLHLDNVDEAAKGLSEQESTSLLTGVTGAISTWAVQNQVVLKRTDTDKMFLVTCYESLQRLIQSRFDILDVVREMTRKNKIPLTLSIGIANDGKNLLERLSHAQAALDIVLARGGDQAAIHNADKIRFFGGKTNAMEKRTRVRARAISHAMSNLVLDSDRVLVMGHTEPDMDALGAAIGMVKFVRSHDRKAYIVLDESNHSIEPLLEAIEEHDYLSHHLISPEEAFAWIDDTDTLLILVDTHKPSLTIEPFLIERAERIVVIDHHRRGEDFVKDAVLVYLEPYASSTCELVTELLQYQEDRFAMDTLEATALLAGIVVDTNNFSSHAGSRTFEAASFLRRHGADLTMVQSLLKEDLSQFVKRAEVIQNTELLYGRIALAMGDEEKQYHQLVIAQAADTLLNMQGVAASFVIAQREDGVISVSARSQGDLNVQLMMEQLGGGGHLTKAACQFKNISMNEARERVIQTIDDMLQTGGERQ